ncbi:MAG: aspartate aminotransferase family protein [Desulfobulbaceae bacterium]|nr:MAG: aspartate aminotransferase family protein [Desulfobulbaceae bacterium]
MNHITGRNQKQARKGEGDINISHHREQWHKQNTSAAADRWLAEDKKHFLHQSLSTPCLDVLISCSGSSIENLEGKKYLDFHGNSVHQVGFSHPRIVAALTDQLQSLSFCTRRYTNIPAIELASRLSELMGGGYRALFSPGATSAVGMALKLSRMVTGRFKTISMWDSFHGASLDAISVGGESIFREGVGPLLTGCEHVPPPDSHHCIFKPDGDCDACELRCARYIEYILDREKDVCAVIAEPLRCTAVNPPPAGFWRYVRDACDKHGTLLIFDETALCLGRTAKMFAHQHYDVKPDLLILGKGLGGGILPFAALLAKDEFNTVGHTALGHYTHEKNPLCCRAGLEVLNIIRDERLLLRAEYLGAQMRNALDRFHTRFECITDVRSLGLMAGVYLDNDDLAEEIMYECLTNGLSFKISQGKCLTLTPPLTIDESELQVALAILEQALVVASNRKIKT